MRDVKNNRKGFYRYSGQKKQAKESIHPLISEKGQPVITNMDRAEVLKGYFFLSLLHWILIFLTALKLTSLNL